MKYLMFLSIISGILTTSTLNFKAGNYANFESQENLTKTDSSVIKNVNSSEYADYYLTLIPQPELIFVSEIDMMTLKW